MADRYDRTLLLYGEARTRVLTLEEVQRYGQDSFGDPSYVSLYGMAPAEWYARGVRVLGRTAVECTRDALAQAIADDVAAAVRDAGLRQVAVLDPFAGSANTRFWLRRRLAPALCIGFEKDDAVHAATAASLALLDPLIDLRHLDHREGLPALELPEQVAVVVFVAPPWGTAFDPETGLDLSRTEPPVPEVVALINRVLVGRSCVTAVQVHERVQPGSIPAVVGSFDRWTATVYDLDGPGRNHGLLLGLTHRPLPAPDLTEAGRSGEPHQSSGERKS
jgi:hypothetical protein